MEKDLIETENQENSSSNSMQFELFNEPFNSPATMLQSTDSQIEEEEAEDSEWEFWGNLLNDFDSVLKKQNKVLLKKIQSGLPKAVRGSVWHYLAKSHPLSFQKLNQFIQSGPNTNPPLSPIREMFKPPEAFQSTTLESAYVDLLKLSSPYEKMIIRDLARTFPKHEFFKKADGIGQEALFNVMKAYSLYDSEMPDEHAFACLAHLMNTFQFRGLFTPRMEGLQLRLYQFDQLFQELMPKVYKHLEEEGIRSTMYASQWFLTLFAYRFPLELVCRVLDLIFASGVVPGASGAESGLMDTLYERVSESVANVSASPINNQSSLITKYQELSTESAIVLFRFGFALLKKNEETLCSLEFEPLLEFLKNGLFEIYISGAQNMTPATTTDSVNTSRENKQQQIPKKAVDALVKDATSQALFKIVNKKKLIALRKEYEEELKKNDPAFIEEKSLQQQNARLISELKRAEKMLAELNKDHCDLAGQLVTIRVAMDKEKELNQALRNQIKDLKVLLQTDLNQISPSDLSLVLSHEITYENMTFSMPPVPKQLDKNVPNMPEQIEILTKQNHNLLLEMVELRHQYEELKKETKTGNTSNGQTKEENKNWTQDFKNKILGRQWSLSSGSSESPHPS